MKYFATDFLKRDKPLMFKTDGKKAYWYSYEQKKWITTFCLEDIEGCFEVTEEQVQSFLYMRELVS